MHAPLGVSILALLLVAAIPAQINKPQQLVYQIDGPNPSSWYGDPVEGGLGDIDRDGYSDFMAGSPHSHFFVYSGRTGVVMYQLSRNDSGFTQNGRIRAAGDVNKDGYVDVLVGATGGGTNGQGRVYVVSGVYIAKRTAPEILRTLDGEQQGDQHSNPGKSLDVNKDGHDDILIGAPGWDNTTKTQTGNGKVYCYSGKDGKLIYSRFGSQANQFYGCSVDGAGDINKDTYPDIIVGSYGYDDGTSADAGLVEVISGQFMVTGKGKEVLYQFKGRTAGDRLGGWFHNAIEGNVDINLDTWPDIAVGANSRGGSAGAQTGTVYVLSGQFAHIGTGKEILYQWDGTIAGMRLGSDVNFAEDVNQDGWPDVIAGAPYTPIGGTSNIGRAIVWSGRDGKKLFEIDSVVQAGNTTGQYFGWRVDGVGDVNKDGRGEVAVGAWNWGVPRGIGRCYVIASRDLMLATDEHQHSLGGTSSTKQNFLLDAGTGNANRNYLLASALGTGPIRIGAVSIPLSADPWLIESLGLILGGNPFFPKWTGTLDANGKATTSWTLPPNSNTSLIGLTLWQAYLVWHKSGSVDVYDVASNPVPMTLIK